MKRLPDWRTRLHAAVEARRARPFGWDNGADCVMFGADCIEAMTGQDPAARFRARYTTAKGALKAIRSAGYSDLADAVAAVLEEIPPAFASAGDVALVQTDTEFGWVLGVVIGEQIIAQDNAGLATFHREAAVRAFKVP